MPETKAKRRGLDEAIDIGDDVDDDYEEARSKIWLGRKRFNGHDPDDPRDPDGDPLEAGS